jgi:hypothetical protein
VHSSGAAQQTGCLLFLAPVPGPRLKPTCVRAPVLVAAGVCAPCGGVVAPTVQPVLWLQTALSEGVSFRGRCAGLQPRASLVCVRNWGQPQPQQRAH